MRFSCSRLALVLLLASLVAGRAAGAPADSVFRKAAADFFDAHCTDCHDGATQKGGVNLEALDASMSGRDHTDLWTRVFDRVYRGEMPPPKRDRPPAAEVKSFLATAGPRLTAADRAQREVAQRRLNRVEYENTVRDLLAIDIGLQHFLPEDQQAGGFDNNGDALALSTEQMQGYLEAARAAVDAAIVTTPQPKMESHVVDSYKEVEKYLGKDLAIVDGRIVCFTTNDTSYSKISTRAKRTTARGKYRLKFEAASHNTQDLGFFTLTASNAGGLGTQTVNLGYFEVGPEPKTFEVETMLDAKVAVQFFPLGLPGFIHKNDTKVHPGVGIGPIEVTGPIIEQWPPASHARLLGDVDPGKATLADAEKILRRFVPLAFRRPVTEEEIARFTALAAKGLEQKRTFLESLRTSLVAVLCSPNFIYLRENHRPETRRVSDVELASRLSYFLWSSMPDEELLASAQKGELRQSDAMRRQVERMLKSPKAQSLVKNFTGQWLRLRQINDTTPDRKLYGKFDELLQMSMVREGEEFFRELLTADLPIVNLLDSNWAMLNQRLAEHYGVPGVKGLALRKVALPKDNPRGGVLTQAGVLKVTANGTTTSPVMRGVWVLENILGQHTPPPPPNTGGIEPDIRGAETIREQLDKHRNVESCMGCHRKIDPPGFALESFDPIGDFRENYLRWVVHNEEKGYGTVKPGAKVDASGQLLSGEKFSDIREFKKLLLQQKAQFAYCLTEKLLTYGLGREMGFSDRPAISAIAVDVDKRSAGLRTLVHAIVQSETFATR